jgi:sugar phosphate isomerase/epimerase
VHLALSGTEISPGEGTDPLVAAARNLGVGWVEFWYPRNSEKLGLDPSMALLAQAGIRVACVATATELGNEGDASAAQQVIIKAVHIAAEIGCGMVNTYFGWPSVPDDKRSMEIYRRNLEPCLRAAEASGVVLVLENEFDGFGMDPFGADLTRRPESVAALMTAVDSRYFRLTFDPCNAYFAGLHADEAYDILAPYISYVHLKDGVVISGGTPTPPGWQRFADHGQHYVTCPLGEGQVGWTQLLRKLNRDNYSGFLSLEPHCEPGQLIDAWKQAVGFFKTASAAECTGPEAEDAAAGSTERA